VRRCERRGVGQRLRASSALTHQTRARLARSPARARPHVAHRPSPLCVAISRSLPQPLAVAAMTSHVSSFGPTTRHTHHHAAVNIRSHAPIRLTRCDNQPTHPQHPPRTGVPCHPACHVARLIRSITHPHCTPATRFMSRIYPVPYGRCSHDIASTWMGSRYAAPSPSQNSVWSAYSADPGAVGMLPA